MSESYALAATTVDLIVPHDGGIVLVKRRNDPFKGYWALPGGFLDAEVENLEEAASRELREETSLIVGPGKLKLVGVYSKPDRDPRGHVISHVYLAPEVSGSLEARSDALEVKVWRDIPRDLAFDHSEILKNYYRSFHGK